MEDLTQKIENNSLDLSDTMKSKLLAASKIGKVLAILILLKMVFAIIGFGLTVFVFGSLTKGISVIQTTYSFVTLVVTLVICFFLLKYLYKFSVCVERGLTTNDPNLVEASFDALKSFFTFAVVYGVVRIIFIIITNLLKYL